MYSYVPSILAEDLWRPILQLAASSYALSWGAEEELEEPLVPTQLDIFRLLELPLVLQLPLPFGEEVEPPREDELELLRVCKNKKHALTQSRGGRQHVRRRKKVETKAFFKKWSQFYSRVWEERDKQNYSKKTDQTPHIICKNTIYESAKWKTVFARFINYKFIVLIMKNEEFMHPPQKTPKNAVRTYFSATCDKQTNKQNGEYESSRNPCHNHHNGTRGGCVRPIQHGFASFHRFGVSNT